jgi:hypothetical protein
MKNRKGMERLENFVMIMPSVGVGSVSRNMCEKESVEPEHCCF